MERSTDVIIESLHSLETLRLISPSIKQISFKYLDALKELHLYSNDVKMPTNFFNHLPNFEKFLFHSSFNKSFEFNKLDKRVCICNMKLERGIFHIFMSHFCHQIEKLNFYKITLENIVNLISEYDFRNLKEISTKIFSTSKIETNMFDGFPPTIESLLLTLDGKLQEIDPDAFLHFKHLKSRQ